MNLFRGPLNLFAPLGRQDGRYGGSSNAVMRPAFGRNGLQEDILERYSFLRKVPQTELGAPQEIDNLVDILAAVEFHFPEIAALGRAVAA